MNAELWREKRVKTIEAAVATDMDRDTLAADIGVTLRSLARWCYRHGETELAHWIEHDPDNPVCTICNEHAASRYGLCVMCEITERDRESPAILTDGQWVTGAHGVKIWAEGATA